MLDELLSSFSALDEKELEQHKRLTLQKTADLRWVPNPGPQTEAYESDADELFYGGAAGGGKTDLLIGLALNEHSRTIVLRREGTDLRGIEQRATDILGSTEGYNAQRREWRLDRGQSMEFGSCQHEKDKFSYQGRPHDLKCFDEITQFTRSQYEYIIGWNRTTKKGQRCRVVVAGNPPSTPEGQWVKECWAPWLDQTFENPALPGELRWFTTIGGKTVWVDKDWRGVDDDGNEIRPKSRTFIPANLTDNPELGAEYRAKLQAMPEPLRSQLLYGDFNVSEKDQHNQVVPTHWIRAAQERWRANPPKETDKMISIGADMAQGGSDETVFAVRTEGRAIRDIVVYPGSETPDGPSAAALLVKEIRNKAKPNIDMGGGYGQSTYDHLAGNNIPAEKMVPSEASLNRTPDEAALGYVNKRAEWWWNMRLLLDPGRDNAVRLPPDEKLAADLAAPTWKLMPRGIQIESKDDIRKRIGRSPDRGDAVVMAFALPEKDELPQERTQRPRKQRNVWAA